MPKKKTLDIPDELPIRRPGEATEHRSFVFYGQSGTGKTTLVGTFPKPVLLLDMDDKGDDSLQDAPEGVDVMDASTWEQFEIAYWWLYRNPDRYKTVVVDTITGAQEIRVRETIGKKDIGDKYPGDWGTLTVSQWGDVCAAMKTWITNFRYLTDLGMEVVFCAQERTFNVDEEADPEIQLNPEIGPRLAPSVVAHLNASVHVVAHTFIRRKLIQKRVRANQTKEVPKIQYCLRIGPDPLYRTKVRKPKSVVVPSVIVDPTYDELIEEIQPTQED